MSTAQKSKKRLSTAKNPGAERLRKQALAEIARRLAHPKVAATAAPGPKGGSKAKSPRPARTGPTSAATSPTTTAGAKNGSRGKGVQATKPASSGGKTTKPRRLGALSAAAQILAGSKKPMRVQEMFDVMRARGLWTTSGKTPAATIHAAICREIGTKGKGSRFRKTGRGLFAASKSN